MQMLNVFIWLKLNGTHNIIPTTMTSTANNLALIFTRSSDVFSEVDWLKNTAYDFGVLSYIQVCYVT